MTFKLDVWATRRNLGNLTTYIATQIHLVVDASHDFSETTSMTPLLTSKGTNIEAVAKKELFIERSFEVS